MCENKLRMKTYAFTVYENVTLEGMCGRNTFPDVVLHETSMKFLLILSVVWSFEA